MLTLATPAAALNVFPAPTDTGPLDTLSSRSLFFPLLSKAVAVEGVVGVPVPVILGVTVCTGGNVGLFCMEA
jgi:hypothetical protein